MKLPFLQHQAAHCPLALSPLQPQELVNSIASVTFGDPAAGSGPYYVVGTAFVRPGEFEPTKGRLVVLQYSPDERKVVVVTEREVKGSVYQVGGGVEGLGRSVGMCEVSPTLFAAQPWRAQGGGGGGDGE